MGSIFFLKSKSQIWKAYKYIPLEASNSKGVKSKPSWKTIGWQLSGVVDHVGCFFLFPFFPLMNGSLIFQLVAQFLTVRIWTHWVCPAQATKRMATGSDCAMGGVHLRASRAIHDAFRIPCVNIVKSWKEQGRKCCDLKVPTIEDPDSCFPGQRQNRNFLKEKLEEIEASTDFSGEKPLSLHLLGMDAC